MIILVIDMLVVNQKLRENKMEIGDKYRFPTSEGYETQFEGRITEIREKAVSFESKYYTCKNHGHCDCMDSDVVWLPKSIINKSHIDIDDGIFGKWHEIMDIPYWVRIMPRLKHHNKFTEKEWK